MKDKTKLLFEIAIGADRGVHLVKNDVEYYASRTHLYLYQLRCRRAGTLDKFHDFTDLDGIVAAALSIAPLEQWTDGESTARAGRHVDDSQSAR